MNRHISSELLGKHKWGGIRVSEFTSQHVREKRLKSMSAAILKTIPEVEVAREEYHNSDLFLKNRRKFRVRPLEIRVPVEKLIPHRCLNGEIVAIFSLKVIFNKPDLEGLPLSICYILSLFEL